MQNYIKEIVPKYIGKAKKGPAITQADQIVKFLNSLVIDKNKEYFIALYLNGANEIMTYSIVSIGILNACQVHPREVFKNAVLTSSASIIVAHNHPSENLTASNEDIIVTKKLSDAGKLLGIKVLDHIIFSQNNKYNSLNEKGLIG